MLHDCESALMSGRFARRRLASIWPESMLVHWPRARGFAFPACRDSNETAVVEVS